MDPCTAESTDAWKTLRSIEVDASSEAFWSTMVRSGNFLIFTTIKNTIIMRNEITSMANFNKFKLEL